MELLVLMGMAALIVAGLEIRDRRLRRRNLAAFREWGIDD